MAGVEAGHKNSANFPFRLFFPLPYILLNKDLS
jgi:hypothetical protein